MSPPLIAGTPPGVAPVIDIGIGDRYDAASIAALWDTARWSTPGVDNAWGGTEPLWNDIACDVLDVSTFYGRDNSIDPFGIGTATVVVRNANGWADYKPPAPADSLLTIRPGRQIRIGVAIAGVAPQWLWRGVIDATEPGYAPNVGETVTFACIDAKGDAGRVDMPRTITPVGYGEAGYRRITRVLDNVKWPATRRTLELDNITLLATELGTKAAAELDRTAESTSGHVYGDLSGKVHYRRSDWMTYAAGTPPDATIGNISGGDVCPSGWEYGFPRDAITTRAIVGRPNETPAIYDRSEDSGLYGLETWERTDLLPLADIEISRIGSRVLNTRSAKHMPRIAAVTLHASTGAGEVAQLLATASPFKPSRYRCRHKAHDGHLVFDRPMMQVVSIRHTLSPSEGWSARIGLDDATAFQNVENPARWSDAETKWSDDDMWAAIR